MDIRPSDLPELRAELVRMRTAIGVGGIQAFQPDSVISGSFGVSKAELIEMETYKVELASLYHVSQEMTELAKASSTSLPQFVLDAEDFPAEFGLIYFNGGVWADWGDVPVNIHIASWQSHPGFGATIAFYADAESFCSGMPYRQFTESVLRENGASHHGVWPIDVVRLVTSFASDAEVEAGCTEGVAQNGVAATMMRVLRAALLLMGQPLAVTSDAEPDRAAKKRLRRAGYEPAPVRVIELRRPKHSGSDLSESSRNYHHRWITRGHWRQQWYATRQVHRPVWIAPHVKGPEGAPMIGGEKVYAWKR